MGATAKVITNAIIEIIVKKGTIAIKHIPTITIMLKSDVRTIDIIENTVIKVTETEKVLSVTFVWLSKNIIKKDIAGNIPIIPINISKINIKSFSTYSSSYCSDKNNQSKF